MITDKKINIHFEGYWRSREKLLIPPVGGIYCVYEGGYHIRKADIFLNRLLYIGEADNIRDSITHHPDYDMWLCQLRRDHELVFALAEISPPLRRRALAALIYEHKPIENDEDFVQFFPYDHTTLLLLGKTGLLKSYYSVYRDPSINIVIDP